MYPLPKEIYYTYADLLMWDDNIRYELYYGFPVALASSFGAHQEISGEIYYQLKHYLKGKQCKAYYAPFDVRLFEREGDRPEDVDVVLQPDLLVVCDKNKIDHRGVHGAPDMVAEVLSPSTVRYDRHIKLNLYQRAGVREYWIVDPAARTVCVYVLENGAYHAGVIYSADRTVPVSVLDDCRIDLTEVFS